MIEETFFDRYYVTVHDTGQRGPGRYAFNIDDQSTGKSLWGAGPDPDAAMGQARARVETIEGRAIEYNPAPVVAQKPEATPRMRAPRKRRPKPPEPPRTDWDLEWREGPPVTVRTATVDAQGHRTLAPGVKELPTYEADIELPIYGAGKLRLLPEWHGNYSARFEAAVVRESDDRRDVIHLWNQRRKPHPVDRVKDEAERWARSVREDAARRSRPPKRPTTVRWFRAGTLRTLGGKGYQIWRSHDLQIPGSGLGYLEARPRVRRDMSEVSVDWLTCDPEGEYSEEITARGGRPFPNVKTAKAAAKVWAQKRVDKGKALAKKEKALKKSTSTPKRARPRNPGLDLKQRLLQ